ncbi:MAG: hypothetical protein ACO1OF_06005 [Adhaeribacter sp.]
MLQIVLDTNKIFTTSEKLLTALLGALFGFGIKALYDRVIERRRRKDIREMIYIDLDYQKQGYEKLVTFCNLLVLFFNNERFESFLLPTTNLINSNIYKSHTARDYYKSFNVGYYQNLLATYFLIEAHSKNLLKDIYDKYIDEIIENKEEDRSKINKKYTQHVESLAKNYKGMINKIDNLNEMAKKTKNKA